MTYIVFYVYTHNGDVSPQSHDRNFSTDPKYDIGSKIRIEYFFISSNTLWAK